MLESHTRAASLGTAKEESEWMVQIVTALATESTEYSRFLKVAEVIRAGLNADRCSIFFYDSHHDELCTFVAQGLNQAAIRLPPGHGLTGWAFQAREIINVPDAYRDNRFSPAVDKKTGYRTESVLCTPMLRGNGACLGVLQAINKVGGPFTRADELKSAIFAAQLVTVIENYHSFEGWANFMSRTRPQ